MNLKEFKTGTSRVWSEKTEESDRVMSSKVKNKK